MIILIVLLVAAFFAFIGAKMAKRKGKDPVGWAFICFFTGIIGILILAVKKDEVVAAPSRQSLTSFGGNTIDGQSYSSEPKTIAGKKYDENKWKTLVEVDDDIASAVETVKQYGSSYVDELAEKYLTLADKAYLPVLVSKLIQKGEAEPKVAPKDPATSDFGDRVRANGGIDPDTGVQITQTERYTGGFLAFRGGLKMVLADGRILLRTDSMKRLFANAEDLARIEDGSKASSS